MQIDRTVNKDVA